jgi:hypothetical protein
VDPIRSDLLEESKPTGGSSESKAAFKPRLRWFPPFAVGGSAAVAGHFGLGMLLFADDRMFEALTVIIGVELGALALGLASTPDTDGWGLVETMRRRWIFILVAFVPAALFVLSWTFTQGLGGTALTQGVGLALLGGLPLYAAGTLLSAMAKMAQETGESRIVGTAAAAGASVGVLVTGSVGIAQIGGPSLLLFTLTLLSGTALFQGWRLDPPEVDS